MKIAVVAAYRQDAAFALGLTMGAWLGRGHAVEVINCFTRSDFAPYSDAYSLHPNDRMSFVSATLKREVERWSRQYQGKLTLTELNLKDAPLRLHVPREETVGLAVNEADKSLNKLRKALERSGAGAIALPLGLGGDVDHLTARQGGLAGVATGVGLAFYEDLPTALTVSEADVVAVAGSLGGELAPYFVGDALEGEALTEAVQRRRRLALCFDSQVDSAAVEEIARYCERYGGRERLWGSAVWRERVGGA